MVCMAAVAAELTGSVALTAGMEPEHGSWVFSALQCGWIWTDRDLRVKHVQVNLSVENDRLLDSMNLYLSCGRQKTKEHARSSLICFLVSHINPQTIIVYTKLSIYTCIVVEYPKAPFGKMKHAQTAQTSICAPHNQSLPLKSGSVVESRRIQERQLGVV